MTQFLSRHYPESEFGGFTDIDGTIAFYSRVNALLQPSFDVVDFGCGRGSFQQTDAIPFRRQLRTLKGKVARVIGIDVDRVGFENTSLDDFRMLPSDGTWPSDDRSVDLILCDWVIEHLENPDQFFREAKRVLRPGGYLCVRTPNARNYIGLISRLVPNRLHSRVVSAANNKRKEEDVFPTLYRCNTIASMRDRMKRTGFNAVVYGYEAEPSYLSFAGLLYALGVAHQKIAPRSIRAAIFAFGRAE